MSRPIRQRDPDEGAGDRRAEAAGLGYTGSARDDYADRGVRLPVRREPEGAESE